MCSKGRWTFLLSVALACFLAAEVPAAEDSRELEGRELFAKGDYARALDIFAKLFAERGDPVYLRNVGRCYQKLKQPEKAIDAFREYLRRGKLKPQERQEVEGFVREMEELQSKQAAARSEERDRAAAVPGKPVEPLPTSSSPMPAPAVTTAPAPEPAPVLSPPSSPGSGEAAPGVVLTSGSTDPARSDDDDTTIFGRWWFWTGVGALVAGGVVTAIVLSSGDVDRVPCPSLVVCPTNPAMD